MKIQNKSALIISILIPLTIGSLSALLSGNSNIYSTLNKPSLSPPAIIFPIVWTILYILMGVSSYIIYSSNNPNKSKALLTYKLQLFFNFCWSIIFFRFSEYLFAFIWLIALIVLIVIMIKQFYKINPLAAYLQIPYLLWCLFAAYLNFSIFKMNSSLFQPIVFQSFILYTISRYLFSLIAFVLITFIYKNQKKIHTANINQYVSNLRIKCKTPACFNLGSYGLCI